MDIDRIDFFGTDGGHSPRNGFFTNKIIKEITFLRGQFFGVVDAFDFKTNRQNHGSGVNRTSKTTSTGFVGTGNQIITGKSQFFFVNKEIKRFRQQWSQET